MSILSIVIDRQQKNRVGAEMISSLSKMVGVPEIHDRVTWIAEDHNIGAIKAYRKLPAKGDTPSPNKILWDETGKVGILFDGALLNYHDMRENAEHLGYHFKTMRDEEVILWAYLEMGTNFLHQIDGMFSIAIIDRRYNHVLLTRDPFGKLPLLYYIGPEWFVITSEMKFLLEGLPDSGAWKCNYESLSDYLVFGHSVRSRPIVRDVHRIEPGEVKLFSLSSEPITSWRYWSIPAVNPFSGGDIEDVYQRFVVRFEESVAKNLENSETQVDILLSGGVDSTAVFCAAIRQGFLPNVYTIKQNNAKANEFYRAIQTMTGVHINAFNPIDPISPQYLMDTICEFDEPYTNIDAVGLRMISSQMADLGRRVAVVGDGGNELMIAYNHYREYIECRQQRNHRWWIPFGDFLRHVPTTQSLILNWAQLYVERFSKTPQWLRRQLLEDSFHSLEADTIHTIQIAMQDQGGRTPYDFLSRFDYSFDLPENILVKLNKSAKSQGVSLRSPLIDRDLTAFTVSLPEEVRLYYENEPKWMLRRYIREFANDADWINQVLQKSQYGFSVPTTPAIHKLWEKANKWILSDDFLWWTSLRRYGVEQVIAQRRGSSGASRPGWLILCLYLWWRKYICNDPVDFNKE